MIRILFYDITQINFFNYTSDLLNNLKDKAEIHLAFEEKYIGNNIEIKSFLNQFKKHKIGVVYSSRRLLKSINPNLVVVNAQRIPDTLLVSLANRRKIPTLMIQHGMYNGHLIRERSLFIRRLYKSLKYLIYAYRIGKLTKSPVLKTTLNFVKTFSAYHSYKELFESEKILFCNKVHVYGDYWISYHKKFFGYDQFSEFTVTGYPHLREIKMSGKYNFCYIAQTLIEDGRLDVYKFDPVLNLLSALNKKHAVIIKRHPRSSGIYEKHGLKTTDKLPLADVYIGHYSSLLALPLTLNKKVALIPIDGHTIPEYFLKGSTLCESEESLINLLKIENPRNNENIEYVFQKPIDIDIQTEKIISYAK